MFSNFVQFCNVVLSGLVVWGALVWAVIAVSGCSSLRRPETEPAAFPIVVREGDELLMECAQAEKQALVPLDVPKDVQIESITYQVHSTTGRWDCSIRKLRR